MAKPAKPKKPPAPSRNLKWTKQSFKDEDAKYSMVVKIKTATKEEIAPGGNIIPMDERRSALAERAAESLEAQKRQEIEEMRVRFKRMQEGKPNPESQSVMTPGEVAHNLMEAGDYGVGSPWPLDYPPPPAYKRNGKEEHTMIQIERNVMGGSEPVEFERCFEGSVEQKCPNFAGDPETESSFGGPYGAFTASVLLTARAVALVTGGDPLGETALHQSARLEALRKPQRHWSFL